MFVTLDPSIKNWKVLTKKSTPPVKGYIISQNQLRSHDSTRVYRKDTNTRFWAEIEKMPHGYMKQLIRVSKRLVSNHAFETAPIGKLLVFLEKGC